MRGWVRRHPFLLFGLVSLVVLALTARGALPLPLTRPIIIVPYLMWLLGTIVHVQLLGPGPVSSPLLGAALAAIKLVAALLPYVVADLLLAQVRQRRAARLDPAT